MSISPFFSGRIPQELYDKADEYCKETGKKRTELLIEALSTYLNFPVKTQTTNFVPQPAEVTKEMFDSLQERVNKFEQLLSQSQPAVIIQDNADNIESPDNDDNLVDNNKISNEVFEDSVSSIVFDDNVIDNKENQEVVTQKHPVYQSITTPEVIEKTGLKQTQIDGLRARVVKQYGKEGKTLTPKHLLERPEEVKAKTVITVDNYPYRLFYLGQNPKGQNLWKLAPDNNSNYQPIITQLDYANSGNDNINYQSDNKNVDSQENEQNIDLHF